jgi:hypothetical protein
VCVVEEVRGARDEVLLLDVVLVEIRDEAHAGREDGPLVLGRGLDDDRRGRVGEGRKSEQSEAGDCRK